MQISTSKSSVLDELDRKIVHALALDGRVSFKRLGEICGCSDQTAARRFRRLQEVADLRVVGDVAAARVGWDDWMVRLQCTPAGTIAVAEGLSRRPDTRWVQLASGGTEIVCVVQARTPEQRDALLLTGLPGSRHVVQITAHLRLEIHSPEDWGGLSSALTADEVRALRRPVSVDRYSTVELDPMDEALLRYLAEDGRMSHAALADALHMHESTVRRRMEDLRTLGVLTFEIDLDFRALGMSTRAFLWLSVEPSELESTGKALARHPEVSFAATTTGPTNLFASVVCRDTGHLFEYLNTRLRSLHAIRTVETAPLIRTLKRTGSVRAASVASR